jgi:hypothetical protein
MNHFEQAQARLSVWITADPLRHHDWLKLFKGATLEEYCSRWAHREQVIADIIRVLMEQEITRTIQRINGVLTIDQDVPRRKLSGNISGT